MNILRRLAIVLVALGAKSTFLIVALVLIGGSAHAIPIYLDLGYTVVVLANYSPPSANIVANVLEQLITM